MPETDAAGRTVRSASSLARSLLAAVRRLVANCVVAGLSLCYFVFGAAATLLLSWAAVAVTPIPRLPADLLTLLWFPLALAINDRLKRARLSDGSGAGALALVAPAVALAGFLYAAVGVGWTPWLSLALLAFHPVLVLQVADYAAFAGPRSLDGRRRSLVLLLGSAPTSFGLAMLAVAGLQNVFDPPAGLAVVMDAEFRATFGGPAGLSPAELFVLVAPIGVCVAALLFQRTRAGLAGEGDGRRSRKDDVDGRKYANDRAERAHREARERDPPIEKGEEIELVLEEVEYHPDSYTIRGRVEGFHVFVDEDVPDDLQKHDAVRAKVLYLNEGGTSATAAFLGYA